MAWHAGYLEVMWSRPQRETVQPGQDWHDGPGLQVHIHGHAATSHLHSRFQVIPASPVDVIDFLLHS